MRAFRKFADVLAVILHPALLGLFIFLFLTLDDFSGKQTLSASFAEIFFLLLIPLSPGYFRKWNYLNLNRKKRGTLLLICFISYLGLLVYFVLLTPFMGDLIYLTVFCVIDIFILLLINLIFKISFHANAVGIILGYTIISFLFARAFGIFPALSWLIGIVALNICLLIVLWQRFVSKSHTVKEIFLGFLSGAILIWSDSYWKVSDHLLSLISK